jgi:hypothetical protein
MDDETMTGWVWACQLYDGTHEWSDMNGYPMLKPEYKGKK